VLQTKSLVLGLSKKNSSTSAAAKYCQSKWSCGLGKETLVSKWNWQNERCSPKIRRYFLNCTFRPNITTIIDILRRECEDNEHHYHRHDAVDVKKLPFGLQPIGSTNEW
jgi:hypothetical protein